MKSIGIVRRIDDLGRIALPKELRRTLNIRAGDPLEIFIDESDGTFMLRKYTTAIEEFQLSIEGLFRVAHDLKIPLALTKDGEMVNCNAHFKNLRIDDIQNIKQSQIGSFENCIWKIEYIPSMLDDYQLAQINFITLAIRDKAKEILGDY
jgi:AbrB family looped-hinge helix DNA binding protein